MSVYRFDDFVLDCETRELLCSGQPVHVSPKAFHLLEVLVSSRPRAWAKSALQDVLWPDTTVVEANLANLVGELRAALADNPARPRYIRTIHRHGYGFLDAATPAVLAGGPASSAPAFVGRIEELRLIGEVWGRAISGARQVMFVAGEPGIGKTSLVAEFGRRCSGAGAVALFGRCDKEALVPFQPFVQTLAELIGRFSDAELRRQVREGGIGCELARMVPALVRRVPSFPMEPIVDPEGERFRLFEAVGRILSRASERAPIAIILEDLHWADQSSLLMLRHLVRSAPSSSMLLLGTYRGEGVERTALGELLADLRRERLAARLSLQGLRLCDVEDLIETVTGKRHSRAFAESLTGETSGNPFFIRELLQHAEDGGGLDRAGALRANQSCRGLGIPDSIKEVIGQRVAQLSDQCNRALSLASVLGCEFRFDLLANIGGFNEDELFDALEAGRAAGVVVDVPDVSGRFGFSHALVREALYERLSTTQRIRLHLRAAEALERLSEPLKIPLADLAYHFTQAAPVGGAERAIEYAKRAAEQAASALAQNEAARFYGLALDALPFSHTLTDVEDLRADLHARRGAALASIGNWPEAKAAFAAALEHVSPRRLELRAELLLKLAMAHFWLLNIGELRSLVTEALGLAERAVRQDLTAEALGWLGRADQADGNLGAAIEIDRKAFKLTRGVVKGPLVHAPLTLYLAGRLPEAVATAERVLADVQKAGDSSAVVYALSHYGLALAGNGQYARAAATFDEARKCARSCGAHPLLARASAMAAGWRLDVFDFAGAESLQSEGRQIAADSQFVPTQASAGIDLLMTYARQDNPGRAERLRPEIEEAVANARGWHGWLFRLRLQQAYAELALARADWPAAVAFAAAALGHSRASGRRKYEAAALTTRARAQYALGRTREAIQDAKSACAMVRKVGDPALAVRTFASLLPVIGDDALLHEARQRMAIVLEALPGDARTAFSQAPLVHAARE